jgi:hypothetical protein
MAVGVARADADQRVAGADGGEEPLVVRRRAVVRHLEDRRAEGLGVVEQPRLRAGLGIAGEEDAPGGVGDAEDDRALVQGVGEPVVGGR